MTKDSEQLKKELISLWEYGYIQQQMIKNELKGLYYENHSVYLSLKVGNDALVNILDDLKDIIEKEDG